LLVVLVWVLDDLEELTGFELDELVEEPEPHLEVDLFTDPVLFFYVDFDPVSLV